MEHNKVVDKLNHAILVGFDKVLGSDEYTAALLMDASVEFYEAVEDNSIYGVYYKNEASGSN